MDGITVTLTRSDAALILYAVRAMNKQIDGHKDLVEAIRAFERQLPVELSRFVDERVFKPERVCPKCGRTVPPGDPMPPGRNGKAVCGPCWSAEAKGRRR